MPGLPPPPDPVAAALAKAQSRLSLEAGLDKEALLAAVPLAALQSGQLKGRLESPATSSCGSETDAVTAITDH